MYFFIVFNYLSYALLKKNNEISSKQQLFENQQNQYQNKESKIIDVIT